MPTKKREESGYAPATRREDGNEYGFIPEVRRQAGNNTFDGSFGDVQCPVHASSDAPPGPNAAAR